MPVPKKKAKPEPKPVKKAAPAKEVAKPLCDHEFQPESGREVLRKKEVGDKELDYLIVSSYTASVCELCNAARPGSVKESFELPTEEEIKDYFKGKDQKPPMSVLKAVRERWEKHEAEKQPEPSKLTEPPQEVSSSVRAFTPPPPLPKDWWEKSETWNKLRHGKYYTPRHMLADLATEANAAGGERYSLLNMSKRLFEAMDKTKHSTLTPEDTIVILTLALAPNAAKLALSGAALAVLGDIGGIQVEEVEANQPVNRVFIKSRSPFSEFILDFLRAPTKDLYFRAWDDTTKKLETEAAPPVEEKKLEAIHVPGAAAPVQAPKPAITKKEQKPLEWDTRPYPDIAGTVGRFAFLKDGFVEHPAQIHTVDERGVAASLHLPTPKREKDDDHEGESERVVLPVSVKDAEGKLRARIISYAYQMLRVSVKIEGDLVEVVIATVKKPAPKA